ncbi:hypothetical protein [Flavobacterium cellulosilyticum]|uniref:hypothetical protein n=1 Tax=Flavobacterium cellulosilyticum TaxID=2541731 RepID=UPI0014043BE5|nr:hypothetical protein [Flavobacterium cellulosilyticum]
MSKINFNSNNNFNSKNQWQFQNLLQYSLQQLKIEITIAIEIEKTFLTLHLNTTK